MPVNVLDVVQLEVQQHIRIIKAVKPHIPTKHTICVKIVEFIHIQERRQQCPHVVHA